MSVLHFQLGNSITQRLPSLCKLPSSSWSQQLLCQGSNPLGKFLCNSWWCDNGREKTGLEVVPGVPLCSHPWSQSSSDRPASVPQDPSTCPRSTSNWDSWCCSRHTGCTRRVRPAHRWKTTVKPLQKKTWWSLFLFLKRGFTQARASLTTFLSSGPMQSCDSESLTLKNCCWQKAKPTQGSLETKGTQSLGPYNIYIFLW